MILFRSMWSSDAKGLRSALIATNEGRAPDTGQSTSKLKPSLRSLGYVDEVIRNAGPSARRDLLRSAPPMLLGARLASMFHRVAPSRRGHALLATAGALAAVVAGLAVLV